MRIKIRNIYNILPNKFKDFVKLYYYNFNEKEFDFYLRNDFYVTKSKNWSVNTLVPLYFIVRDIRRYERYYNILPNDVVIDAGANEGVLTAVYSKKVGENGLVIAVEPDKKNIKKWRLNMLLNESPENVVLSMNGLWDANKQMQFNELGTVGSSLLEAETSPKRTIIDVITLDYLISSNQLLKLDFVKMDIEGAEIEAIEGAINSIKKLKPNFAIASYHIVNNEPTYRKLETIFKRINYPFKTVIYDDGEIITYAGENLD